MQSALGRSRRSGPLLASAALSLQLLCASGALADDGITLRADAPRAIRCPSTVRFKATIPPQRSARLEYRFVGSDGAKSPFYKATLKSGEARDINYVRAIGQAGDKSASGWLELEYKLGDTKRTARTEYRFDCERKSAVVAKNAFFGDVSGGGEAEENLLEEFEENYLRRRGLSLKEPFATARLRHYARLREMRQALRVKHRSAEWLNTAGAGAPTAVDASQCAWSSIGPTNINGRVTGIAIDPANNQRVYVTTVGGIWRSTTAGRRWERVSDDFLATIFASIAVNPATPTEIFAGGGDPNQHDGFRGGLGIMRSTSSGDRASWSSVSPPALLNQVIYRIIVDPSPPNNVYAATSAGVYIGTRTGPAISFAQLAGFDAWTSDIAVDFSVTPRLVYAGVRQASASFGRGIWKYDGTAWSDRSTGIFTTTSRTITLALAPSAPATLYAKVEAGTGQLQGIYKTTTGGETPAGGGNAWTMLTAASVVNDSCWGFCYSYYNAALAVDPSDANVAWAGAMYMYRTDNGGTTWTQFIQGPNADMPVRVHEDHHAIAFDPVNSKIVYAGNDGGVFKSTDTSLAAWNWNDISHGMIVTEYYRATSQQAMANIMGGGTQDNGTLLTFGNRTWYTPFGCDGKGVAIDAADASTVYGFCNGNFFELANPVPGTLQGGISLPWTNPAGVIMSNPVVTDDSVAGAALAAGRTQVANGFNWRVMKTTDGLNWNDIGPPLATNVWVYAIGIAPSSAFATYYVGTTNGAIWRTTDGGATWTSASTGLPNASINAVYVDAANAARALASTSNGIHLTVDTGANWSPINGTGMAALPTPDITGAVFDPSDPNTVYAVTDVGAFRGTITPATSTTPASAAWTPFDEGLPDALDVNDLWVNRTAQTLKIATMGHGAYLRDIRPGITCPGAQLLVRDNVYDRGTTPSPSGMPDPEHPIPDPARPGFYKPDDTGPGRVYWWQSADVRIDVPADAPPKNQVANADHVEAQTCPIHAVDCPAGVIRDADPQRGSAARVYVNVNNIGLQSASNVRVTALFADASGGLPPLPADFWTTTFPAASTTCGALDTSTGWQFADSTNPCPVIAVVNPELPEVARFDWTVPAGQAVHSCMLVIVESADDPIDASVRTSNETDVNTLVPNHRHVSVRNLHVIDVPPPPPPAPAPAGGGPAGGTPAGVPGGFEPMRIRNPSDAPRKIELLVSRVGLPKDAVLELILPALQAVTVKGARRTAPRLDASELAQARELKLDARAAYRIPADVREASFTIDLPSKAKQFVGWVYRVGKIEPGTSGRWTVLERVDGKVVGGNTYFVRALSPRK